MESEAEVMTETMTQTPTPTPSMLSATLSATDNFLSSPTTTVMSGFTMGYIWGSDNADADSGRCGQGPLDPISRHVYGGSMGMITGFANILGQEMAPANFKWLPSLLSIGATSLYLLGKIVRLQGLKARKACCDADSDT